MPFSVSGHHNTVVSAFRLPVVLWAGWLSLASNAALLIVQQCSFRLLSPLIGSSIETWSWIIAAFLLGIAAGSWLSAIASRRMSPHVLITVSLSAASLNILKMASLCDFLQQASWFQSLPLFVQIGTASIIVCLPPGIFLSLLMVPLIRMLKDYGNAGTTAGQIFAMGTLGSLVGNFVAGFYLIAWFGTAEILGWTALGIALLSFSNLIFLICFSGNRPTSETPSPDQTDIRMQTLTAQAQAGRDSIVDWRVAVITVAACSFVCGSLEGAAFRLLAPLVGVSLFLTAGVVGVVLSGMALGNFLGGRLASGNNVSSTLRMSLVFAGTATVMIGPLWKVLLAANLFGRLPLIAQTVCWSFSLFFLPSILLGTITPQVIQVIQRNTGRRAELAGRLCAWSTLGCICGILATSWILIEQAGAVRTCILCGFIPLSLAASRLTGTTVNSTFRSGTMIRAILLSAAGLLAICRSPYLRETQYFAISVSSETMKGRDVHVLSLDRLVHSVIDLKDPGFLHYPHENVQGEVVRWAAANARKESRNAKVLIIGGGGYSLPRWIEAQKDLLDVDIDVVEIDPEVTAVAHEELGLPTTTRISSHHLDGRQFVRQTAADRYDVVIQDAVNDFCVPSHLMTREYNQLIRRILRNDGVYLLTVIDSLDAGLFVSSAAKTMDAAFPATRLLIPKETETLRERSVFVIASRNTDVENTTQGAQETMSRWWGQWASASVISTTELQSRLSSHAKNAVLLTDDYAPVDQLMIRNFLH